MANQYNPVIVLDTTNADLDLAALALGASKAFVKISKVVMVNPTAADKLVLKDSNSDIVFESYAVTTGQDEVRDFCPPLLCSGLKMLTADVTRSTGVFMVYFE